MQSWLYDDGVQFVCDKPKASRREAAYWEEQDARKAKREKAARPKETKRRLPISWS